MGYHGISQIHEDSWRFLLFTAQHQTIDGTNQTSKKLADFCRWVVHALLDQSLRKTSNHFLDGFIVEKEVFHSSLKSWDIHSSKKYSIRSVHEACCFVSYGFNSSLAHDSDVVGVVGKVRLTAAPCVCHQCPRDSFSTKTIWQSNVVSRLYSFFMFFPPFNIEISRCHVWLPDRSVWTASPQDSLDVSSRCTDMYWL